LRIEVGPRDVEAEQATVVRRDSGDKSAVSLGSIADRVPLLLEMMHAEMIESGRRRLAARTTDVASVEEALEAAQGGFARIPWKSLGEKGETALNRRAVSVRCLQTVDGSVPTASTASDDLMAIVGRSY
jgi:prolyl-tRNA synthetase